MGAEAREASLSWIGWNEPKSVGEGGVETDEKDPSRSCKSPVSAALI